MSSPSAVNQSNYQPISLPSKTPYKIALAIGIILVLGAALSLTMGGLHLHQIVSLSSWTAPITIGIGVSAAGCGVLAIFISVSRLVKYEQIALEELGFGDNFDEDRTMRRPHFDSLLAPREFQVRFPNVTHIQSEDACFILLRDGTHGHNNGNGWSHFHSTPQITGERKDNIVSLLLNLGYTRQTDAGSKE